MLDRLSARRDSRRAERIIFMLCGAPQEHLEIGHFDSPPRLRKGGRWHRDGGPGASAGVVRLALAGTSNRTFRAAKALSRYETLE